MPSMSPRKPGPLVARVLMTRSIVPWSGRLRRVGRTRIARSAAVGVVVDARAEGVWAVLALAASAAVEMGGDAAAEAVWVVLAEVPRVGEWSAECRGARWLDGAMAAAPG